MCSIVRTHKNIARVFSFNWYFVLSACLLDLMEGWRKILFISLLCITAAQLLVLLVYIGEESERRN